MMKYTLLFLVLFVGSAFAKAQDFKNMQEYLNFMDKTYSDVTKRQWKFTQAVAHSKRDKKIERRKKQLLETIDEAIASVRKAGSYGGDEFKEETIKLLQYRKDILNDELEKVIDLQKIAEESYDAMEAYFLAQEELDKKSAEVQEQYQKVVDSFAKKNNINFVEGENDLAKKMRLAGEVFDYKNDLYLIYFKAQINQGYLFESLSKSDVNGIQQNYNALQTETAQALEKLKSFPDYKNKSTLKKKVVSELGSFLEEANKYIPEMIDFLVKNKDLEQMKATLDKTPQRKRTKKMIDAFNKKVGEVNKMAEKFNKGYEILVNKSNQSAASMNNAFNDFVDRNVPQD